MLTQSGCYLHSWEWVIIIIIILISNQEILLMVTKDARIISWFTTWWVYWIHTYRVPKNWIYLVMLITSVLYRNLYKMYKKKGAIKKESGSLYKCPLNWLCFLYIGYLTIEKLLLIYGLTTESIHLKDRFSSNIGHFNSKDTGDQREASALRDEVCEPHSLNFMWGNVGYIFYQTDICWLYR